MTAWSRAAKHDLGAPESPCRPAYGFLSPDGTSNLSGYCSPPRGQYASGQPLSSNPLGQTHGDRLLVHLQNGPASERQCLRSPNAYCEA